MSSRLKENIISLFTLQAMTYVLPLVTLPYLARVLGSENFGRIVFAGAVVQYFLVLTDYGFNLSATRRAALLKDDPAELSRMLSAVTALKLFLCLCGMMCMAALVAVVPAFANDWLLYYLVFIAVLGHAVFPGWLFQGLQRMSLITGCTVVAQVLSLLALLAFVRESGHYRAAAGLQAAAPLVAGVAAWFFVWRTDGLRLCWPGWFYLGRTLQEGWHVFLSTAAISLYTTTNIVVLGLITNPEAVAYFGVADKLIRAFLGLISPVSQAVYPHIARLGIESREAALAFIHSLLRWQLLATLLLSLAIFVFADSMIELLFGPDFAESKPVIQWMSPLPLIVGLSNVLGIQTMLNFGMKRSFSRIVLGSGLINLALLLPLAYQYAAQGAAISILLTELTVVILMALSLARSGLLSPLLYRSGT